MGIGHAWVDLEIAVFVRLLPDDVADSRNPVVRGTHEGIDAAGPGIVKYFDDGFVVLEFDGLGPGFLVGDMVDGEKLVIAEQDSFHGILILNCF